MKDLQKIVFGIVSGLAVLLGVLSAVLFFRLNNVKNQAKQTGEFLEIVQKNLDRVEKERADLQKKRDQLQADALAYMGSKSSLEAERDRLTALLDEARKKISAAQGDVKTLETKIEDNAQQQMTCPDNQEVN
ncbi:MAG: hypothetical protein EOM23_11175, partial [Candidatus Moranbacteria bacterium]|nr:hypothetical protein [Candidatus Moranbacteria bacterium]